MAKVAAGWGRRAKLPSGTGNLLTSPVVRLINAMPILLAKGWDEFSEKPHCSSIHSIWALLIMPAKAGPIVGRLASEH